MVRRNGTKASTSFNNKTKAGQKNFLEGRRKELSEDLLRYIDRAWLTSIMTCMSHEELRSILIHVYSEIRPDALTLEILTREVLHDVEVTHAINIKFTDKEND